MRISGNQLTQKYTGVNYSPRRAETRQASDLEFKRFSLEDMPVIRKYMDYNEGRTCDYTLGGIFMWVDYFDYEYCITDNTLFIKGISENHPGMVAFSLPLGELPLKDSIKLILDYCKAHNIRPAFSAIPTAKAKEIAEMFGGKLEALEGWSDYLYDAHSLATLQGKAYSKKRNHVNRFIADNPDYRFEMITDANLDEALAFFETVDLDEKEDKNMASYELEQCKEVMRNLDKYLFDGAILRGQDGKICALTLGEVVGDTLFVHVEKMNHDVSGAGEAINKMFASEMMIRNGAISYINREEDMNDSGLRFAKESYHPVALLDKSNILF
ncbi:MAG: phosphatidylglycerol lysyltransferase domain-containing protein [Muribaculaceae bacterium]|nr:phosphatidylglycerol lysyltransferase domain-containing protein [Muribaculaceae bacterium]